MLNCLIIEDEPIAAEIIRDYIHDVPFLKLTGICRDVLSASEHLSRNKIDVLFIDIHLPKISGIEFLKTIPNKYQVILTTAYHQYALEGYDLNVVDYLLKPIEFSRFLQAVNKLHVASEITEKEPLLSPATEEFRFFNVGKRQVKVTISDIVYIESLKEYVKVYTFDSILTTKLKIGDIESMLGAHRFLRIHKSYVINQDRVTAYDASQIELGTYTLPIGRTYKESVRKILEL